MGMSKRHETNLSSCDRNLEYNLEDAVSLMKSLSSAGNSDISGS